MWYRRVIINDELEGMLQEAIVAYFKVIISQLLPWRAKEIDCSYRKEGRKGKDIIILEQ
jgi:hypothetical protein